MTSAYSAVMLSLIIAAYLTGCSTAPYLCPPPPPPIGETIKIDIRKGTVQDIDTGGIILLNDYANLRRELKGLK